MMIYNVVTLVITIAAAYGLIRYASDDASTNSNPFISGICLGSSVWAIENIIVLCWSIAVPLVVLAAFGISVAKARA